MDTNQLSLVHDPKLPHSLYCAIIATTQILPDSLATSLDYVKRLCLTPSSQHRPIGIKVHAACPNNRPFQKALQLRESRLEKVYQLAGREDHTYKTKKPEL